eukprot:gene26450-33028_t
MMKNISAIVLVLSALVAQSAACDAGSAPKNGVLAAHRLAQHCDAGSAPFNGECTFCPVGKYALAGAQDCTPCPPGFWAPINSVSKDACYPLSAFKVAETCDAGSAPFGNALLTTSPSTAMLAPLLKAHCDAGSAFLNGDAFKVAEHCDAGSAPINVAHNFRDSL